MQNLEDDKSFVPVPRYIADDRKNGKLTPKEWELYIWMRTQADPYGKYTASISALRADLTLKSDNYVNKLLLSLLSKNYIHFQSRQGRRGSFVVRFADFMTPHKKITTIDKQDSPNQIPNSGTPRTPPSSEVGQNLEGQSQKLIEAKQRLGEAFSFGNNPPQVRSGYNDNEKENEK